MLKSGPAASRAGFNLRHIDLVQLDGAIALVERTRAGLGDFGGRAVAEQACIGGQRADRGAAEQPPERQVRRFPGNIPKRDIQGR